MSIIEAFKKTIEFFDDIKALVKKADKVKLRSLADKHYLLTKLESVIEI